ncbi:MAG: DUF2461 domain-containing protein [Prolixibacteraceae bacterium]|nr:DUF2461 domain-containing protein [Prolixibacteraceae bacterium]
MNKVLEFLEALNKNNNREWFHDNKNWYDESREKFLFVTDVMINEIRKFDPEIPAMSPKDCMFRIFRDVRFSNDKRPYKTNFGSYISKGGRKGIYAGYYFHISPDENFVGGGIYMPSAEPLKAVRSYIANNASELLEIINQPVFKKMYPEMYDDKLKSAPKGFPKDHEYIELLRYKSFIFSNSLSHKEVVGAKYIEKMVAAFCLLQPFNQYLNEAVDKIR